MDRRAAKVCWARDQGLKHVQTWKPNRGTAMATAMKHRPVQVDIYSRERAPIVERLQAMHSRSTWRDPETLWTPLETRLENTPFAHTLAGACVWLRKRKTGQHDVSADLLWCFVMQEHCAEESMRVRNALVAAWVDMHKSVAELARTLPGLTAVERAAALLVQSCITGTAPGEKIPVQWKQWQKMQESGERMLWSLADLASKRAESALR